MRMGWSRRRVYVAGAAVILAVPAGVLVPVTLAADSDEPCWSAPESVTRLAKEPAAASAALDPGAELEGLGKARKLLSHERMCDAASVGKVIEAGTVSSPGRPHTKAQARAAYAVAGAFSSHREVPRGLEPYVARMLADHMVDTAQVWSEPRYDGESMPGGPTSPTRQRVGKPFWDLEEVRTAFEYDYPIAGRSPAIEPLYQGIAHDPAAFAVLYDAERAYFAALLEHLDPATLLRDEKDMDGDKTGRKELSFEHSFPLKQSAERMGSLMQWRSDFAKSEEIPDLGAFDREVRSRLKGSYAPAARLVEERPLTGDIVRRPAKGKLSGHVFDGQHQLTAALDVWVTALQVPERTAELLAAEVEEGYVLGLAFQGI